MGMFHTAGEAVKDLFRHERVTIIDENGNQVEKIIKPEPLANPFKLLGMLTFKNWLFFIVGLAAWTVDGYDYHSVSLSLTNLSVYYGVTKTEISTAMTLTLLFRSLGAVVFGIAGDFYGRKWPMVINMFIIGALQIGTIYAPTYGAFLAVRSLFGIGMGGVWGCAIAMALESVPLEARGLMSGILQQGYALGYLFAAVFNLSVAVAGGPSGYKSLFWIGAGASFFVGIVRIFFPESQQFLQAKAEGKTGAATKQFRSELVAAIKTEWKQMIYACILMSWFNFFSHTTQDSYPTFLQAGKGFDQYGASLGTIIAKVGACIGGTIIGYVSQSWGRRRSIVVSALLAACVIPAWVLPTSQGGLAAGSFFLQFFVQGAWGVIPVHLNELSPPAFRASFPGFAYQIGNMISSPAAQMVTGIAEHTTTYDHGKWVQAFGPTMAIATAIIALGTAGWTAIGKEQRGSHFEYAVAGHGIVKPTGADEKAETGSTSQGSSSHNEKAPVVVDQEKGEVRSGPALRKAAEVKDSSAPNLNDTFGISQKYDAAVLGANIENWASLLGSDLTPETRFVEISKAQGESLLKAYDASERHHLAVAAAAKEFIKTGQMEGYINQHEQLLMEQLGENIQKTIDGLSEGLEKKGCFVKTSSRSPKDAAARSGVFQRYYSSVVLDSDGKLKPLSENDKLRILCDSEAASLRFENAKEVIRALVLSERVWQDMTLALRHPDEWKQNVVLRRWEPVDIDLEFRTFVHGRRITAISQYAYQLFSERLNDQDTRKAVVDAILATYESKLKPKLGSQEFSDCVLDFGLIPPSQGSSKWRVILIEINPFMETTDGGLFSWQKERSLLEGEQEQVEYPVFRATEKARTGALVMIPNGWKAVIKEVEIIASS